MIQFVRSVFFLLLLLSTVHLQRLCPDEVLTRILIALGFLSIIYYQFITIIVIYCYSEQKLLIAVQ